MSATTVRGLLRECAEDLAETEMKVHPEHVVRCAYQRHGDVFEDAQNKMMMDYARKIATEILRGMSEDDGGDQLSIPGLGFPTLINVTTPDGGYFVRTDKATWPEIEAGERQREANVDRAVAKLDSYREGKETVRPYMEHDHTIDVAAAIEAIKRGE